MNRTTIKDPVIINNQKVRSPIGQKFLVNDLTDTKSAHELISVKGGESFFNYIDWLGLVGEPDLLVLSSMHHYFYDAEDLRKIRTVVNLMPLNQINYINLFLQTISHFKPDKCYFTGCFTDYRKYNLFAPRKNSVNNSENIWKQCFFTNSCCKFDK